MDKTVRMIEWFSKKKGKKKGRLVGEEEIKNFDLEVFKKIFSHTDESDPNIYGGSYAIYEEHADQVQPFVEHKIEPKKYHYFFSTYDGDSNKPYRFLTRYAVKDRHILHEGYNTFYALHMEEILAAEKKMGREFPSDLRTLYESVGYGHLVALYDQEGPSDFQGSNLILPPNAVACFYIGQLIDGCGEYFMSERTHKMLKPGDLPFFKTSDRSGFMVMKLDSSNPNAVWSDCGVLIEDSFERFIWRLHYRGPSFYKEIIENHDKK